MIVVAIWVGVCVVVAVGFVAAARRPFGPVDEWCSRVDRECDARRAHRWEGSE